MTAWHWVGWAIAFGFGSLPVIFLLYTTGDSRVVWLWPITTLAAAVAMDIELKRSQR